MHALLERATEHSKESLHAEGTGTVHRQTAQVTLLSTFLISSASCISKAAVAVLLRPPASSSHARIAAAAI